MTDRLAITHSDCQSVASFNQGQDPGERRALKPAAQLERRGLEEEGCFEGCFDLQGRV